MLTMFAELVFERTARRKARTGENTRASDNVASLCVRAGGAQGASERPDF